MVFTFSADIGIFTIITLVSGYLLFWKKTTKARGLMALKLKNILVLFFHDAIYLSLVNSTDPT